MERRFQPAMGPAYGRAQVANVLPAHGADVNAKDRNGMTPMAVA